MKEIGEKLKEARESMGITIEEAAVDLKIRASQVESIEDGDKDAFTYNLETTNHKITKGLGIFEGVFCPHYQNNGLLEFHEEIKNFNLNGYALENGAALKIGDDGFTLIKQRGSSAFMFDKNDNHKLIYLNTNDKYDFINLKK